MSTIYKTTTLWTGFTGAPGYTNLYFTAATPGVAEANDCLGALENFWGELVGLLPADVQLNIQPDVPVIEDTTGEQTTIVSTGTPPQPLTGAIDAAYSAISGAFMRWSTGVIRNGRAVRGRSFLVPVSASIYSSTGTILPSQIVVGTTAGQDLVDDTTCELVVYSRPSVKHPEGASSVVAGASLASTVTSLRTRRD